MAWDDGLDDVPWASLTHAYGPAGDVPGLLRLLAHPDAEVRRAADWELNGTVVHQGTLYEATPEACRFLGRLAVEVPHARWLATMDLAYIAGCDAPGGEAVRACAAAVAPLAAVATGPAELGAVLALAAACPPPDPAAVALAVEAEEEPGLRGLAALVLAQAPEEAWRLAELRLHLVPGHPDLRVDPSEQQRAEILARHLGR